MRPTTPHIGRWDIKQNLLWNCISERREPLFRKFYVFLNLRSVEPFGDVDHPYPLDLAFGVLGARDHHFGISVPDREQGSDLAPQGLLSAEVVANLDISFHARFHGDKVHLFFVELSHIDFVAAAQKFDRHDVFVKMTVVGVFRAYDGVAQGQVGEIIFFVRLQISFPLHVESLEGVKQKPTLSIKKSTIIFKRSSFSILNLVTMSLVMVVRTIPFKYFFASSGSL